jgi:hypothetical protein
MNKKYYVLREVGKVMVNLGNLTFASLVLGGIIKGDYDKLALLLVSGFVAALFITVGIIMLTTGEEEWK